MKESNKGDIMGGEMFMVGFVLGLCVMGIFCLVCITHERKQD